MKVLVTYASRHGATQGIAERIAATLELRGFEVDLRHVDQARDLEGYDAFVVGSAAYVFHWLKEATGFIRRHRSLLATRPVWLFSSGPLGTELVDDKGRDVFEASEPKEWAEFRDALHPRDMRIFFGAYDPTAKPIGLMERFMTQSVRAQMPAGDFRDWPEIEAWATGIADALTRVPAAAGA